MRPDFTIRHWAFDPTMLATDGELLTAFSWNGRNKYRGGMRKAKSIGQSPLLLERSKGLASVARQTPSPDHSPASSFSESNSSSSSSSSSSFSTSASSSFSPSSSNEYFAVRPSPKGGLGAFAIRDIPVKTTIIAEKPLLRVSSLEEIPWRYHDLSRENKKAYNSLHRWIGIDKDRLIGIFKTNRFELKGSSGVFDVCSRFNHSCHPYTTCTYSWDMDERRMKVTALRDIVSGEELTISYMGYSVDQNLLQENYGFECDCPGCREQKTMEEGGKKVETVAPLRSRHRLRV